MKEIKKLLPPTFQSLYLELNFNRTIIATATGFIVESKRGPVLLTNRHNVTGKNQETGVTPATLSPDLIETVFHLSTMLDFPLTQCKIFL